MKEVRAALLMTYASKGPFTEAENISLLQEARHWSMRFRYRSF